MRGGEPTRTGAATLALLACLACHTPRRGLASMAELAVTGAAVRVEFDAGDFARSGSEILEWVRRSASIVAQYYRRRWRERRSSETRGARSGCAPGTRFTTP